MRTITLSWETWRAVIDALRAKGLSYMREHPDHLERLRSEVSALATTVAECVDVAADLARDHEPAGLELSVEVGRSYGSFEPSPRLLMRPVRRGNRGRWIYSGISWTDPSSWIGVSVWL